LNKDMTDQMMSLCQLATPFRHDNGKLSNCRAAALTNLSPKEQLGLKIIEILKDPDLAPLKKHLYRALRGWSVGAPISVTGYNSRTGQRVSVKISMRDSGGTTQIGYVKDLTTEGIEPNPGPNRKWRTGRRKIKKTKRKVKKPLIPHYMMGPLQNSQTWQDWNQTLVLTWDEPSTGYNNPGGPVVVPQIDQLNDAYDLVASILTNTLQGLNNTFAKYRFARIEDIEICKIIDNYEQVALDCWYFVSAQNIAANFPTITSIASQAGTKKVIMTDTATEQYGKKSQVILYHKFEPWKAFGDYQEYTGSGNAKFSVSSGPVSIVQGALVCSTPNTTIPTGFSVRTRYNIRIKFYDALDKTNALLASSELHPRGTNIKQPHIGFRWAQPNVSEEDAESMTQAEELMDISQEDRIELTKLLQERIRLKQTPSSEKVRTLPKVNK